MAKPSLKASPEGVVTARAALQRAGLTQQVLRVQVGCSRQPITNFFKGAAIAQPLFISVCEQLGLDWQAIADLPDSPAPVRFSAKAPDHRSAETATLLTGKPSSHGNAAKNAAQITAQNQNRLIDPAQIRAQVQDYTLQRCQSLTLLGRARGRQFEAIAPQLKILHSSDLYDLAPQESGLDSGHDAGANASQVLRGAEAVARYPYLHILGAPGAGKSTFLKYLALQCIEGKLEPQRVPIFIALREIAEPLSRKSLFEAIAQVYQHTCNLEPEVLSQLFKQGDILLLLDGEDEIAEDLSKQLVLTNFSLFYRNHVVISCRTAAHQRLHQDFTQASLEPFDHNQIQAFLDQWFEHSTKTKAGFLDWLGQIQTDSRQSYELAETPLLLTLLCMTFENSSSLPQGKLQIYELAFESLLDDWNSNHMTPWSSAFAQRSHGDKMRILKAIASAGFSQPEKRFSATRRFIAKAQLTNEDLANLSAKDFLNDIERLYGLIQQEGWNSYRFSHLSFHEYLMALSVLEQLEQCDHAETPFQDLLRQHCFDPGWYEVFCFVIEGLPTSQALPALTLMANQLQDYLAQQNAVAQSQVEAGRQVAEALIKLYQSNPHSPSAAKQALAQNPSESALIIRAFCTDYHYKFDLGRRISHALKLDYAFNHDLVLAHCFKCNLNQKTKDKLKVREAFVFSDALTHVWKSPDLHRAIQAVETVTEVRDLFFNYVLQHPELFREEVCDRFTDYAQAHDYPSNSEASSDPIHPLANLHPRIRQAISKLVGTVSRPDQERHPFLQTEKLQFPIAAYGDPEAVQALQNYYQGCTLLCDALRTRSDISSEQRELLLQKLF